MGNCATKPPHSIQQESSTLSIKPEEIQLLKNKKLPTLHYFFQLADIKLKKCEHPEIELKFKIADFNWYTAPLKTKDQYNKIDWKVSHSQQCDLTEYELSQKELVIEAYNHKQQLKGSFSINLYLIWNGPCHLDFKFQLQKSKKTRIAFNLKISQQIQLKIENLQTSLTCNQPIFPDDCFTFWIQSLISHQLQPSNHTYLLRIKQQHTQIKQSDLIQTYSTSANDITWKQETGQQWILPQIDKKLFTHQIRYSTLHLTFFKVFPNNQNKNDPNFIILGSCFISLPKLINKDYKMIKDNQTNITYQQFQSTLSEKLWLHGKQVGKSIIRMKTTIQNHQKQMLTCVRTEKGIEISSPVYIGGEFSQSQQVLTLRKILDEVQNFILDLEQGQDQRRSQVIRQIISNIISLLSKLLGLISRTSRQSAYFYQYNNQLQMIQAQRVMIDVAFKVLSYIKDQFHYEIEHICWQVLTTILKRDEFSLSNIGFSKDQKQMLRLKKKQQIVDLKIQIGLKYQQLLYHLLQLTLDCLVVKGDQAQKAFAQAFCAYAYFRIPVFRQHILSVVVKPNDPQIPQLKNLEGTGGRQSGITRQSQQLEKLYNGLFNWQQNFYSCIENSTKFKSNQLFLSHLLKKEHKWKERLQKRKGAFYTFLDNLIKEVQLVCPGNNFILWQSLPGYYQLVHAFLVQMKEMKLKEINDRFKRCSLRLLSNQKLLNIFMIILLKKTNVYQSDTTLFSLALFNQFFEHQKKMERLICCTFDYKYFLIGLKGILESQYEYNISQVIILIYNNFDYFSREFTLELMLYLMSKYFFRFFFHWSFNLRKNFHTLIYVKLHPLGRTLENDKKIENQNKQPNSYYSFLKMFIQQRFEHLFQIIQAQMSTNAQQTAHEIVDDKIIYKKMKLNLLKKMKDRYQHLKVTKQKPMSFSPIHTTRSSSQTLNGKMMIPRKKIFFENEQLKLVPISPNQLSYMKKAVAQYKALIQTLQKIFLKTPDYEPQLKLKKVLDEKEYGPMKLQDW